MKTFSNTLLLQLKKELSRLEELKKQHMQKFVEALRKELAILWDKCHYGKEQRQEFRPFYEGMELFQYIF